MPVNQIVIHGTKGLVEGRGITAPGRDGEMRVATETFDRTRQYSGGNCWAKTVAGFSQALLDGRSFSPSGIDGLRSVQLTDAIAASARDGVSVSLEG